MNRHETIQFIKENAQEISNFATKTSVNQATKHFGIPTSSILSAIYEAGHPERLPKSYLERRRGIDQYRNPLNKGMGRSGVARRPYTRKNKPAASPEVRFILALAESGKLNEYADDVLIRIVSQWGESRKKIAELNSRVEELEKCKSELCRRLEVKEQEAAIAKRVRDQALLEVTKRALAEPGD